MSQPWIIIPVHNRKETTLACLRRLAANGDLAACEILVVDDGSSDGTAEAIAREYAGVRLLRGDGNWWWTGAIARGSAQAFAAGAPLAIWLNDDCLPQAGALRTLQSFVECEPRSIAAPVALDGRSHQPVATAFHGRTDLPPPSDGKIREAGGLSGYCMAVGRAVWEELGGPDAVRFPHYYGETAYTLRARAAGMRVVQLGDSRVELVNFDPPARSPAQVRGTGAWRDEFARVFLHRKSRFRLATQWHLLRLKYGHGRGSVLAGVRLVSWMFAFTFRR